jgi:hypothetical protein
MGQRIYPGTWAALAAGVLVLGISGCAAIPYPPGLETGNILQLPPGEPQIERGHPNKVLDIAGNVTGIPAKILLFNWRIENHDVSPETEAMLQEYLENNNLKNVKVRLNQYAPGAEWGRLKRNKSVGAGWRWTLGTISLVFYTILPDRFFSGLLGAGDSYNPYTNTISIYSDHHAVALHEGGHAKDLAGREWKGTYAALTSVIPFVPLYPEALATGDAVGYLRLNKSAENEEDAYKVLYPAYGTYIGGSFGQFIEFPYNYAVYFGSAAVGHIVGRIKAATVDEVPPPRE